MSLSLLRLLLSLVAFRLLSVFLVRSWFVPDEVYQSAEVAHVMVFGSGHLTWEWSAALRSALHPSLIAVLYYILSFFGFSSQQLIAIAPRIQHAVIFSFGDVAYFKLAERLLPTTDGAFYAKMTYLSSWFVFYCAGRTLSNSLETALTLFALLWYPWEGRRYVGSVWPYMAIGFLTIVIRPTAALIWLVLGINHVLTSTEPFKLILCTAVPTCLSVMGISIALDSLFYGRLTSTAWNFLMFNVLTGGSAHFGVHPWYWFFTEGIPSVLTVQIVPVLLGIFSPLRPTLLPLTTSMFYILFHSCLPHKEQRFLLPIIPLLCLYGGAFFADRRHYKLKRMLYWLVIAANVVVALYTGLVHQVGPYDAADAILARANDNKPAVLTLMPCYSVPGWSYLRNGISELRQLDCTPDLKGKGGLDEADYFYSDPLNWLNKNPLDRYDIIIVYEKTYLELADALTNHRFSVCDRVFHSHFLTSSRQDNYILVLCK